MKKILSNDGVTLLEVIISVAILLIICSMSAGTIYSTTNSREDNGKLNQNSEKAVGMLDKEFSDTSVTGTDTTVKVTFPGSIGQENVNCETIKDSVYGINVGIVRAK
jgi:prepilin-type N-terminal cleavage/methylation domain-containing protein